MIESKRTSVGLSFLMTCTKTDFSKNRREVLDAYNLEDFDLPSYYYMTLHRPKFEKRIFDIDSKYSLLTREAHLKKAKRNDISNTKKNKVSKNFYSKIICTLPESLLLLLEKCKRILGKEIWKKKQTRKVQLRIK